jgi:hypothetical protein
MKTLKNKIKLAGFLIIVGMIAGMFSIASVVDSANFLTEAAANSNQVIISALFQFILFVTYLGFAILLYPIIKKINEWLALGFLSFRIIAGVVLIIGTIILLSILVLSQEFVKNTSENVIVFEGMGNMLKITRDYINHIFMVFTLGIGNLMLYFLFLKSGLIPKWFSAWGIFGTILSVVASLLLLFKVVDVITFEYLVLNSPTALFEVTLGLWLMIKGFGSKNNSGEVIYNKI